MTLLTPLSAYNTPCVVLEECSSIQAALSHGQPMDSDVFMILSVSIIMWVRGYLQVEMNICSCFRDEEIRHLLQVTSSYNYSFKISYTSYMQYSVLLQYCS